MLLIYQYHEDFKCKKNPLRLPVVRRYVAGIQQPATNPRLIIRADDMGSFRSANIAVWKGIRMGWRPV